VSPDDKACLKMGREVARMIADVRKVAKGDDGYARRKISFPGGSVHMFLANSDRLADLMDSAANGHYESVTTVTPPSELN
jgi:hypothetical protein